MFKTIVVVTLFALTASAMAIDPSKIREATTAQKMTAGNGMSANPLMSFQNPCQNCVGAFPICLWCANAGAACFSPTSSQASCCGCLNGACYVCPSSSSCAVWSPYNPNYCPPPSSNNNSTVYGTCNWKVMPTLQYQERSVLRCHSIPPQQNTVVSWTIRGAQPEAGFSVWIVDQRNFDLYISGQPFACLNPDFNRIDTEPKYGHFVNAGTPGYYIIITKTNRNLSGTSSYLVDAFIQ